MSYAQVQEALRPLAAVDHLARARPVEGLNDLGRLFNGLPLPPATSPGDPGQMIRTNAAQTTSAI